jgi:hypothetical protein
MGTDNGVLTPRMREFGYGNETVQTLGSEFVGGLWNMLVTGRVAEQCIILTS